MSLTESARSELRLAGYSEETTQAVLETMERFYREFDSGGAASVMVPVLVRCLYGLPLTPLTGADDEWEDRSDLGPDPAGTILQNKRCSQVFRRRVPKYKGTDGWTEYVHYDVSGAGSGWGGYIKIDRFPYKPKSGSIDPVVVLASE